MTTRRPKHTATHPLRRSRVQQLGALAVCLLASWTARPAIAADFLKPTPEELSMTSLPGYPGAPAVILFREEITNDDMHSVLHYERVKILTEEGKKYANVELGYFSSTGSYLGQGDDKTLENISGRTIHPDGTVIPFTGKPYLKVLEKTSGYKVQQKVFTLPDVEVGSIIEYRYYTRINDNIFESPIWMVQDDLFVKSAHFAWYPTTKELVDEDSKPINSISWFPILPPGNKIEMHDLPAHGVGSAPNREYELHIKDVPPRIKEEHMPPIGSFSYRVNFSFTPYRSQDDYWQNTGKQWSKHVNSFAGPNGALRDATAKITAGATTPDEKLHKIYEAVMGLENTRFTRARDEREDKAAGMGQVKDAADVLTHGRGTPTQITELFIGMARAAGLQAYAMWVPDRSEEIFTPQWLSTRQLDDLIAVVAVNGQDVYFDPGSRFCPYGQLAWQHTIVGGVRQTEGGPAMGQTGSESYKVNRVTRVANLKMDAQGQVTGKIDLGFYGAPALRWRQSALRGDDESIRKELKDFAENMLPRTLELEDEEIQQLSSFDKPLMVSFKVTGTVASAMGKRTLLPGDVFLANHAAAFPHEKRELAVYFEYPQVIQDAVRINLPHELTIEAVPAAAQYKMLSTSIYSYQVEQAPTSVTTRRSFAFGDVLVMPKDYAELRKYYAQLESKDQESVILKAAPAATAEVTAPASK